MWPTLGSRIRLLLLMRMRWMLVGTWIWLIRVLWIAMLWVWLTALMMRHRPTTVRMDRLTAHVNRRQWQANTGRNAWTIDAEVDRWHTYQSGLAWNTKQASGLGSERAGSLKAWSRDVPHAIWSRSLADGDSAFRSRASAS